MPVYIPYCFTVISGGMCPSKENIIFDHWENDEATEDVSSWEACR